MPADPATQRQQIAAYVQSKIGDPYVWGATGPNAFDCSGLVDAAYNSTGANLGRPIASTLGKMGQAVSEANAQVGDVVYFDERGSTDHVGIYIGGGKMIDAPHAGASVEVDSIAGYSSIRNVLGGSGVTTTAGASPAGFDWNPLNWPKDVAQGTVGQVEQMVGAVMGTIGRYVVDAFLVVVGVVLVVVALVLVAKAGGSDARGGSSPAPAPASGGGGEEPAPTRGEHEREPGPGHELGGSGAGAGEGSAVEDAAVAAA